MAGCEAVVGDLGDVAGATPASLDCFGGDEIAVVEVSCCEDLVGVLGAANDTVPVVLSCSGFDSGAFVVAASLLFARLIDGSALGSGGGSDVFGAGGP